MTASTPFLLAATADEGGGIGVGGWIAIIVGVSVLSGVLWAAALIFIVRSEHYTVGGKVLWVFAALPYPIIGPLVWFVLGRNARIVKEPAAEAPAIEPPAA